MSERCPLGDGLYWNGEEHSKIPDVCLNQCEATWDKATQGVGDVDILDSNCDHEVEYNDTGLQRGEGSKRFLSILYDCMVDCPEAFSESWPFECPYNQHSCIESANCYNR